MKPIPLVVLILVLLLCLHPNNSSAEDKRVPETLVYYNTRPGDHDISPTLTVAAQEEETITSSFQRLAQRHIDDYKTDPRILVYYIPGHISETQEGWRKSKCVVSEEYTCDIQKTDSVTTPYKAYLTYKMIVLVSPPLPTKELAENTEVFKNDLTFKAKRITFSFQDGRWIPEKYEDEFQVERSLPPFWFEIKQNPTSSPFKRVVVKILDS